MIAEAPYEVWTAFVDICISSPYEALERIGAESQARVLSRAFRYHNAASRGPIRSVRQFVQVALSPGYLALDRAFHACEPEVLRHLERYLDANEPSFVERVDE